MNNVVDRVATEVLSNGAVRWEQFDSSGNSLGYVYLKRADEPTVVGTAINKVLFDSIKDDLNSRLLIANKATQAQAEAGTDNTNYMTALRVMQEITAKALPSKQMSIKAGTISDNGTIPQTSGYSYYLYFVSPNDVFGTATTGGNFSTVGFGVECEVDQSTREVTCRMATQSAGGSTSYTGGTANYLEIAWN